jgi:hypothetical protein
VCRATHLSNLALPCLADQEESSRPLV